MLVTIVYLSDEFMCSSRYQY